METCCWICGKHNPYHPGNTFLSFFGCYILIWVCVCENFTNCILSGFNSWFQIFSAHINWGSTRACVNWLIHGDDVWHCDSQIALGLPYSKVKFAEFHVSTQKAPLGENIIQKRYVRVCNTDFPLVNLLATSQKVMPSGHHPSG